MTSEAIREANGEAKEKSNGMINEKGIGEINERIIGRRISLDDTNTQPQTSGSQPKRILPSKQLYVRPAKKHPSGSNLATVGGNHDVSPNPNEDAARQASKIQIEKTNEEGQGNNGEETKETIEAATGDSIVTDKGLTTAEDVHETSGKSKRYSSRRPQPHITKASTIPIEAVHAPEFQPKRFMAASNSTPSQAKSDTLPKLDQVALNASHDPTSDAHPSTPISNNSPPQYQNRALNRAGNYASGSSRKAQFATALVHNDRNFDSSMNTKFTAAKNAFGTVHPSHVTTNTEYQSGPIPNPMMGMSNGLPVAYAPPGYMFVPQYGYPSGMPQMYGMQHDDSAYGSPYAYFSPGVHSPSVYPATTHANYNHGGGTVFYSNPPEERSEAMPAGEPVKYVAGMYNGYIPPGATMMTTSGMGPQPGYFYSPQPYWHPGTEEGSVPVNHTG